MTQKQLIVYVRGNYCPDTRRMREFLSQHAVPYRVVDTAEDSIAQQRVVGWTGFLSFPTLVVTNGDGIEPVEPPLALRPGQSPRDVDRGTILTEASLPVLHKFLKRHGFIS